MPRTPAVADPKKDIPPNRHLGWCDRDFEFRTLCLEVARARGIGAMVQLANQLHRPLKRMKPMVAVVADVHQPSADRTVAIKNIEFPRRKIRVFRPCVWHPAVPSTILEVHRSAKRANSLHARTPMF